MRIKYFYNWGHFFPVTCGADSVATNHLRYFRERNWEVDCILALNDKASWASAAFKQEYSWLSSLTQVKLPGHRWEFGEVLAAFDRFADRPAIRAALATPADVFFTNYVFTSPLVRHLPSNCRRLLESIDIMSDQFELSGASMALPAGVRRGRRNFHYRLELDLYRLFDGVAMISRDESETVRNAGARNAHYVPQWLPVRDTLVETPTTDFQLLFVGSRNAINLNGIHWFLQNVYDPHLSGHGIRLAIAGGVCEALNYSNPNVVQLGRISDSLERLYASTAIVVAPIFEGTGLSIKTVEAMAMGKVVVAAPSAARGLAASQLVTLDMKANPQAVADTILRILADPAERRALELRAFTYARREFGKEAYFNAMDRLFESIGIAAGTRRTKAA